MNTELICEISNPMMLLGDLYRTVDLYRQLVLGREGSTSSSETARAALKLSVSNGRSLQPVRYTVGEGC